MRGCVLQKNTPKYHNYPGCNQVIPAMFPDDDNDVAVSTWYKMYYVSAAGEGDGRSSKGSGTGEHARSRSGWGQGFLRSLNLGGLRARVYRGVRRDSVPGRRGRDRSRREV